MKFIELKLRKIDTEYGQQTNDLYINVNPMAIAAWGFMNYNREPYVVFMFDTQKYKVLNYTGEQFAKIMNTGCTPISQDLYG